MQLALLETEFSPEKLSRKLKDEGFQVRLSRKVPGKIAVRLAPDRVDELAAAVANYVLGDWLAAYVGGRLAEEHPYLIAEDQEYIRLLIRHGWRDDTQKGQTGQFDAWQQRVEDTIDSVLRRSSTVNIRGILRFRAGDMLRYVDITITDTVEHFLADREYEEFVGMLRVMLEAQPRSTQTLHVYCTDERVWLCDESGNLLRDEEVTSAAQQVSEDGTVDTEDLAMSILIMRSPCAIVIHDLTRAAPWPSFAETVERVFLHRVRHCEACSTCEKLRQST